MKKAAILFLTAALLFVLTAEAWAAEVTEEIGTALDTAAIQAQVPGIAQEILGETDLTEAADLDSGLGKIWDWVRRQLGDIVSRGAASAAVMICVVLLCSVAGLFCAGEPDYVTLGGSLAISAAAAGNVSVFIGLGRETLQTISDFSKVLLPSLATAAAASGSVTAGAAKYAASALFMDILITLSSNLILPLISLYIAAAAADCALGGKPLQAAANLIKWLTTTLMTALAIVFTAYLSITGIISDGADAVTVRVAKTSISTVLPVVGGIISDAASSIASGLTVVKNTIGVFGLLVTVCVCVGPFLNLGVHYLMYKAAAGVSAAMSESRLSKLIGDLGTAFGMILAMVGVGAAMLFVSIVSSIKAVNM